MTIGGTIRYRAQPHSPGARGSNWRRLGLGAETRQVLLFHPCSAASRSRVKRDVFSDAEAFLHEILDIGQRGKPRQQPGAQRRPVRLHRRDKPAGGLGALWIHRISAARAMAGGDSTTRSDRAAFKSSRLSPAARERKLFRVSVTARAVWFVYGISVRISGQGSASARSAGRNAWERSRRTPGGRLSIRRGRKTGTRSDCADETPLQWLNRYSGSGPRRPATP